jgi:uncharacterized protein YbjT (DUF2867 family)/tryptophan-rich sensory protein
MHNAANQIPNGPLILLTGATGYVGGRLLRALQAAGRRVRCLARRPEFLRDRVGPATEVVQGDVLDTDSLNRAMAGVTTAYYLVHSMGSSGEFEAEDRRAAQHFGHAARAAGVRRIIYLGGLGDAADRLSPHLRSRHEVGEILRAAGLPAIEFRASIVIGSGSLSFELIRSLVERLPIMIAPRWVDVPAQPIAINDLLAYLIAAIDLPLDSSRVFEIGGADRTSYGGLMREYASQRGLARWIIPVPVLTPRLSSLWLGLVTPIYARVGRKLIDSMRHPTVVDDESALDAFSIRPVGFREAIAAAIRNEDAQLAETRWSDALSAAGMSRSWFGVRFGSRLIDSRVAEVRVPGAEAFQLIERIGGRAGWYYGDWLWQVRGAIDLVVGGVGMRRGRRDPNRLRVGDTLDCWRVEAIEPNRRLRLAAEMRLPGRAWLEFEVTDSPHGPTAGSRIRQTAEYDPIGVLGRAYWYAVYPLHKLIFAGMLRQIAARAESARALVRDSPCTRSAAAQLVGLMACLVVCLAAAAVGGMLTASSVAGWYQTLRKPAWTPPDSVFGPVWLALYLMMGVASWLVWRRSDSSPTRGALTLFGIQLGLNVAWSGCFFALRNPGLALAELSALLVAIAATTAAFRRVSPLAAALMLPYLAWSTFAAVLNTSIWWLNS